jgi:predicted kinase
VEDSRPFILVICGPPCSGKSTLARVVARVMRDVRWHEMDDVCLSVLPGLINDESRRSAAYRIIHSRAARDLLEGSPVLLSATYQPQHHRSEVAHLALRLSVPLYVVQCICGPDEAARRFRERRSEHAGADLTASRVKRLSESYERFEGALVLDTSTETEQFDAVDLYLASGLPVDPIRWAQHVYLASPVTPGTERPSPPALPKLSESSVRAAKGRRRLYALGWFALWTATALGIIPIAEKTCYRIWVEYSLGRAGSGLFVAAIRALGGSWWHGVSSHSLADWATWGTFCLATAGFGSIVIGLLRDTKHDRAEAKSVVTAGDTPRYLPEPRQILPSDREVYHAYLSRIARDQARRMPIPNVPVFFRVLPLRGCSFSAVVPKSQDQRRLLCDEAAAFGLDWSGFAAWLRKHRRHEYFVPYSHEYGLRCVGLDEPEAEGTCYVSAVKCSYDEYMCGELAVNYCAPGNLPDMRRLLEGPSWDTGDLDLLNVAEGAKRYSMRLNVTGLVLSEDGYFILQRRSGVVGHGLGSLAGAVNGAADYYADCCDYDSGMWLMVGKAWRCDGSRFVGQSATPTLARSGGIWPSLHSGNYGRRSV